MIRITSRIVALLVLLPLACSRESKEPAASSAPRPSILLVTLDTTRADAIGSDTPSYTRIASTGLRFQQAYATCPQTLPSHSSMMTGLYPAGHGVHENGRYFAVQPVLAERLREHGYTTAAFVSAFALAQRFGLARGFERYDDAFGGERVERNARETTERVLQYLQQPRDKPAFVWVHYYDPHFPYAPPEPFRSRYPSNPYHGEIASMDEQLGRLVDAFRSAAHGPSAIVILGDHGEGLGEHGEAQHGNLLYQAMEHVPLVIAGPGVAAGSTDAPVSTRRVFHTILDWAGIDRTLSLRGGHEAVVIAEGMKPFLDYGWQPQVMAVQGRLKAILSGGKTEVYDVVADPREARDLAASVALPREARAALRDYPLPSAKSAQSPPNLSEEERRKLASLGYVSSGSRPVVRAAAPRPADMAHLFDSLDEAAALFVRGEYARAIPVLEKVLAADPHNLDAALRLATSHSSLGHDAAAVAAFENAEKIAPDSADVHMYFALHLARGKEWKRAVPMLERIASEDPDRLPALEALAVIREREGRLDDAIQLRRKIYAKRTPTAPELSALGAMAMEIGATPVAIDAFERARAIQGAAFNRNLELGVLYLASRRFNEARDALDRVSPSDKNYAMAAFKRAQVSVLLNEPDAAQRIARARQHADATTRELIARERLFAGR